MSDFLDDLFGENWQDDTEEWPKAGVYNNCVTTGCKVDTVADKRVFKLEFETADGRKLNKLIFLQKSSGEANPAALGFFRRELEKAGFTTDKDDSISVWFGKVQDFLIDGPKLNLEVRKTGKYTNVDIQGKTDSADTYDGPISVPVDDTSDIPF